MNKMIVDVNAYLGHYAFRRLPFNTPRDLLKLMEKAGIDRAMVASASSIMYRNAHEGNRELYEQTKDYLGKLIPIACLNPNYAGWKEDLYCCVEEFGMKGLRLYPSYQDIKLLNGDADALINEVTRLHLPIYIVSRLEDYRAQEWFTVDDMSVHDIVAVLNRFQKAKFILTNINPNEAFFILQECPKADNFYIETTGQHIYGTMSGDLQKIIDQIGSDRVLFGSGMPFRYPEVSVLKVTTLDIKEEDKEKIFSQNAIRLWKDLK